MPWRPQVACQGQWQSAFRRHLFGWGPVGRLASAQGSQLSCFRIGCVPILPGLSVLRCQFAVGHFGLLASPMRGWRDCQAACRTAGLRWRLLHSECHHLWLHKKGRSLPNGRLGVSPKLPQCVSCLRFMYFRFHTALWDHWGALWFISTQSLFMSYSLNMSSSSWRVADRWIQHKGKMRCPHFQYVRCWYQEGD